MKYIIAYILIFLFFSMNKLSGQVDFSVHNVTEEVRIVFNPRIKNQSIKKSVKYMEQIKKKGSEFSSLGIYINGFTGDIDSFINCNITFFEKFENIRFEGRLLSVPKSIFNLKNIKFLDFEYIDSIPTDIENLINIKGLNIWESKINDNNINDLLLNVNKNITNLNLGANNMTTYPIEMKRLQNLQYLYFYEINMNHLLSGLLEFNNLKLVVIYFEGDECTRTPNKSTFIQEELFKNGQKTVVVCFSADSGRRALVPRQR